MGGFQSMPTPYAGEKVVAATLGFASVGFDSTGVLPFSGSAYITYDPALVKGGKVGCSVLNPMGRPDFADYGDVGTVTCAPVTKDGRIRVDVNVKAGATPIPDDEVNFPLYFSFVPKTDQDVRFTFPWDGLNTFGTTTSTATVRDGIRMQQLVRLPVTVYVSSPSIRRSTLETDGFAPLTRP